MGKAQTANSKRLLLVNIIGALILGPLALLIFMPALPSIKAQFDVSIQFAQLGLSLPLIAALLTPLLVGRMVDIVGRRPLLLLCYLLVIAGSLLCIFATDYWLFLLGRILVGAFSSANVVIARAVLQDIYQGPGLQQAAVRFSIPPALAVLLGPLIGGLLIDSYEWHSIFWLVLGISIFLLMICWFSMPETISLTEQSQDTRKISVLTRSKSLWAYIGQSAFQFAVAFAFASIAPYIVIEQLGRSTTEYSIALMGLVTSLMLGIAAIEFFAKTHSIMNVAFFTSMLGMFVSWGFLVLMYTTPNLPTEYLIFPCMLVAFCIGLGIPPTQAGIVSAVPAQAGTAAGLGTALQMLAAIAFTHIAAIKWDDVLLAVAVMSCVAMTLAWLSSSLNFFQKTEAGNGYS